MAADTIYYWELIYSNITDIVAMSSNKMYTEHEGLILKSICTEVMNWLYPDKITHNIYVEETNSYPSVRLYCIHYVAVYVCFWTWEVKVKLFKAYLFLVIH